jgi:hypothetical protein
MPHIPHSRANTTETRLVEAGTKTTTYKEDDHTVDAILSTGSPVQRDYGTEVLKISPDAVDLSRLKSSGIPFLDSHDATSVHRSLGRLISAWFSGGKLLGRLRFNDSPPGRAAEKMARNSELSAVSIGYKVNRFEITDADGEPVDPDRDRVRWDQDLIFRAVDWILLEISAVNIAADSSAMIRCSQGAVFDRALPAEFDPYVLRARALCARNVVARMRMRHRAAALRTPDRAL